MFNPFFQNCGPVKIKTLLQLAGINYPEKFSDTEITNIKDLVTAEKGNITFFHLKKYEKHASKTKGSFCLTTNKLSHILPKDCKVIIVDNVLMSIAKITEIFYPNSISDDFDYNVKDINETPFKDKIKFGKNVLIGLNVQLGKNCSVGHNSIIESNVTIGDNCSIGSNVLIRNTIIKSNVNILDSCVIGKKGFGFFPNNKKNIRYPHIGMVIVEDNSEIGCGSIIDRGSLSNTVIGKNTFLDNHVHIAHNNKIGNNCIIAGQVGFAGSSTIGDNVIIGGQAGISGHLKVGKNTQIAGGSGVIKDIPENSKVMGYPARDLKKFIKDYK
tara:strand:- start:671 stop:1651 length:981 start_codon:yes stop_codon:yes gene_type:complete